jgi:hypothetical protein
MSHKKLVSLISLHPKNCISTKCTYLHGLVWVPVALKLVLQSLLQLLSENVNAPPRQFVVQVGDYEVERNLDFDVHRGFVFVLVVVVMGERIRDSV